MPRRECRGQRGAIEAPSIRLRVLILGALATGGTSTLTTPPGPPSSPPPAPADTAGLLGLCELSSNGADWCEALRENRAYTPCNLSSSSLVCDGDGRVRELTLAGVGLRGHFPRAQMHSLDRLTRVDISDNEISGSLPADLFGRFEHLSLERNLLSGTMPNVTGTALGGAITLSDDAGLSPDVDGVGKLVHLGLSQNRGMSGTIPSWLGYHTSLEYLSLSGNMMSGTIPSELGQLSRIRCVSTNPNLHIIPSCRIISECSDSGSKRARAAAPALIAGTCTSRVATSTPARSPRRCGPNRRALCCASTCRGI